MSSIIERANEEKARKIMRGPAGESSTASEPTTADTKNALQNVMAKEAIGSATSAAKEGDALGTIGGGMMTAGLMTPSPASPYLLAGGLGLQVLGAGEKNKRAEKEAQRQAYNERIKARQQAMANIANIRIE